MVIVLPMQNCLPAKVSLRAFLTPAKCNYKVVKLLSSCGSIIMLFKKCLIVSISNFFLKLY